VTEIDTAPAAVPDNGMEMAYDAYVEDVATGDGWRLHLADACELLPRLDDDSIDMSVFSPPFASLFTYSASPRDLGNSRDMEEFLKHYAFITGELARVMRPGRIVAVHAADYPTTKAHHGVTGLKDLPGALIAAHVAAGFVYHGRVMIDKNPQAQAQRTKAQALLFVQKNRDSVMTRPAIGDSLLIFRAPGENQVPIKTDVTNEEWIAWARPVWLDIRETNTLNERVAREDADERHICPLQLEFIERCIRLWSNRGETVLSPFAGIGSEGYVAVGAGRRFIGTELKASYWHTAVDNLRRAEAEAETAADAALFEAAP